MCLRGAQCALYSHWSRAGPEWQELCPDSHPCHPQAPLCDGCTARPKGTPALDDEELLFMIELLLANISLKKISGSIKQMVIPILRVCVTTFFLQATASPQAPHWKRHCDDCVPSKCSPSSPSLTPHRRMWGAIVTLLF